MADEQYEYDSRSIWEIWAEGPGEPPEDGWKSGYQEGSWMDDESIPSMFV